MIDRILGFCLITMYYGLEFYCYCLMRVRVRVCMTESVCECVLCVDVVLSFYVIHSRMVASISIVVGCTRL